MSVAFPKSVERVTPQHLAPLVPLLPHLTKALEIGRTFLKLKAKYKASLAALDHVNVGMGIVTQTGELIVKNAYLSAILDDADGVQIDGSHRPEFAKPGLTDWFRIQVAQVCQTAKGQDTRPAAFDTIQRPSGKSDYLLEIAPLRDSSRALDQPPEAVLITVIDPDAIGPLRLDRFGVLYGLTPSEIEVCQLIAEGLSTHEIAERRATSEATTKNQVAAVLSKTEVSSRLQLLRLAVRTTPPVV